MGRFPAQDKRFDLFQNIQSSSGAHPAFYSRNILGFSLGVIVRRLRMCSATYPFLHMQICSALGKVCLYCNIESITILRENVQLVIFANERSRKRVNNAVQQRVLNNSIFNLIPLNPELNHVCYLLALLAHHFLHVTRIRVKSLTLRLLMSYKYGAPILDVSRSHTTTQHSR